MLFSRREVSGMKTILPLLLMLFAVSGCCGAYGLATAGAGLVMTGEPGRAAIGGGLALAVCHMSANDPLRHGVPIERITEESSTDWP